MIRHFPAEELKQLGQLLFTAPAQRDEDAPSANQFFNQGNHDLRVVRGEGLAEALSVLKSLERLLVWLQMNLVFVLGRLEVFRVRLDLVLSSVVVLVALACLLQGGSELRKELRLLVKALVDLFL